MLRLFCRIRVEVSNRDNRSLSKHGLISILALLAFGLTGFAQENNNRTINLHGNLDTGLTSCDLEAGNGFDLALLDVEQPFVVEVVRFHAQSFPNMGEGPVTVSVYEDPDSDPTNGALLLATAEAIMVGGNAPHPYTVPFNNLRVTQPYLYVVLSFSSATVINASSSSQEGGFSFSTACNETGLENVISPITLEDIRLGIEVLGHPEQGNNQAANQNTVPVETETIIIPTLGTTEPLLTEEAPIATAMPTETESEDLTLPTEESQLIIEVTAELTPELTPELTEDAGDA